MNSSHQITAEKVVKLVFGIVFLFVGIVLVSAENIAGHTFLGIFTIVISFCFYLSLFVKVA